MTPTSSTTANNELQAVMAGPWKLHLPHTYRTLGGRPGGHDGLPVPYEQRKLTHPELYNLEADVGETKDLATAQPDEVKRLLQLAEVAREDLGDSLTGREGTGRRQPGRLAAEGP